MNKTRLNQILRILSLPYIESGLAKKDSFKETIKAYCAYIEDTKQFNPARKTSAERNYAKMREAYVLFLAQKLEGPPQSLDDVFLISDKFFARSRVLDFVDRYHQKAGDMVDYLYIDNIFQIANSLLTTRDGIIAIRTWKNKPKPDFEEDIFGTGSAFHKVEIWNALTRILPTDIFIAAFVVINSADIRLLYRQHATISLADKLLAQVLEKGTAETHLHKNASVDYQMTWEQFMTYAFWEHQYLYPENSTFDEAYAIYLAYLYRMLTACYLENLFDDKTFLFYITDRFNEIYDCFIYGKKESWKSDEKKQVFLEHQFAKYREFLFQYDLNTEKEILDLTDYDCCDDLQTHTELVFRVKALERCRDMQTFPLFRLLFLQYLRIKNQFYQNFLQQNSIP
ncbi:MAG: hypothetical protein IJ733_16570 [Lachnospiraceae bacterium]|nr:hypothetical protein [Lachnospiraceae bacterium]